MARVGLACSNKNNHNHSSSSSRSNNIVVIILFIYLFYLTHVLIKNIACENEKEEKRIAGHCQNCPGISLMRDQNFTIIMQINLAAHKRLRFLPIYIYLFSVFFFFNSLVRTTTKWTKEGGKVRGRKNGRKKKGIHACEEK